MNAHCGPTREEIITVIDQLIAETRARADVSAWAVALYVDDQLTFDDDVADALEKLGAVDLIATDRPFLYTNHDFEKWKSTLMGSAPT